MINTDLINRRECCLELRQEILPILAMYGYPESWVHIEWSPNCKAASLHIEFIPDPKPPTKLVRTEIEQMLDEIVRLRAALQEIVEYKELRPGAISWATDIARRALEGKVM